MIVVRKVDIDSRSLPLFDQDNTTRYIGKEQYRKGRKQKEKNHGIHCTRLCCYVSEFVGNPSTAITLEITVWKQ